MLYWQIGRDILARQAEQGWGAKVVERLAHDLRTAFPEMKGFSPRDLKYMRAFAEVWPEAERICRPPAAAGGSSPLWQTPPLRLKPGAGRPMGHAENHRADRAGDPG